MKASLRTLIVFLGVFSLALACLASSAQESHSRRASFTRAPATFKSSSGRRDADEFFNKQFWQDVTSGSLAGFASVALGIPVGLWLAHLADRRSARQLAATKLEQRKQLAIGIDDALQKNIALVEEVRRQIGYLGDAVSVPTFNVDLTLLDATAALKYDSLGDAEACRAIDSARFELEHFGTKLRQLFLLHFDAAMHDSVIANPGGELLSRLEVTRASLIQSVRAQLPTVLKECERARTLLEKVAR